MDRRIAPAADALSRGVERGETPASSGELEVIAREVLQRRTAPGCPRPIVVALSGGGDSLALALIAGAWAKATGRRLLILTVDHGLQPDSPSWSAACAEIAARLGHPFQPLRWTGERPAAGLPAAARHARHRLLATAAQEAGARVLLLGHTADDIAESQAMRRAGSTTPDPREWTPSPAWPEGRGLFLLRPLLRSRRATLRAWLAARGETWIEDPANTDPRYARARARAASPPPGADPPLCAPLDIASQVTHRTGIIALARARLRTAPAEDAHRLVGIAAVCAGGGTRLPSAARVARAATALRGDQPLAATLAGARLEADEAQVRIFREAGEISRGALPSVRVRAGQAVIWDGRFEVTPRCSGELRQLAGLARRLPREQQAALREIPAAARGALPAIVDAAGGVTCPAFTEEAVDLIPERLRAAAGLIDREPA